MGAGDSALFWTVLALAGTTAVTAYAVDGAKARNLWITTGILIILAGGVWFGLPSRIGAPAAALARALWIAYPLITVTAVVLVIKGRTEPAQQLPSAPSAPNDLEVKRRVLDLIARTLTAVESSIEYDNEQGQFDTVAELKATLLSVSKGFGAEIPDRSIRATPNKWLQVGKRYLTEVGQLLQQGHFDEAKQIASELVPVIDAFLRGETD